MLALTAPGGVQLCVGYENGGPCAEGGGQCVRRDADVEEPRAEQPDGSAARCDADGGRAGPAPIVSTFALTLSTVLGAWFCVDILHRLFDVFLRTQTH